MQVVINGFGRIGRSVLRAWEGGDWPEIDIVGINDIAAPEMCAYLFEKAYPLDAGVATFCGALPLGGRRTFVAVTCE